MANKPFQGMQRTAPLNCMLDRKEKLMNIIEAWNRAEYGHEILYTGSRLYWKLTKKHGIRLIKLVYDLGIGDEAFLSDTWEVIR